ncbi:putative Diguanylate cyclase [Candidatus Defluviicoccus seviourii]|uniref:Diguanylate cyclase n=2 Tax=root TaxID=1 RepID=A0A564WHR0_9PROT|nr:putative Diguanylate cyclase [uncultured Defluviicoccus sp.]VUX47103.1 putative Diguanylate cyclase [Candidatus Defluviicoccus seviourii]
MRMPWPHGLPSLTTNGFGAADGQTVRPPRHTARLLRHGLLAALLLFGATAAFQLSTILQDRADGMSRYVRVDAWAVGQLEYELQQFRSRLARHVAGDAQAPWALVAAQLNTVRATLPLLHRSQEYEQFRLFVDVDGTAAAVGAALDRVNGLLTDRTGLAGDLATLSQVEAALAAPLIRLRQLMVDVATVRSDLQDGDLANVRWLIGANRWMLLAFGGITAVFILLLMKEALDARRAERIASDSERKSRHIAEHDGLTGLPNRMLFHAHLREAIAGAAASGHDVLLLTLDLDGFRDINDTFGHDFGDSALTAAADRLRQALPADAFLVRLGGDEFAVIRTGSGASESEDALANHLLATFQQPLVCGDRTVQLGTSIGAARFPVDGTDAETVMRAADLALHAAKAAGRACFQPFRIGMMTEVERRQDMQEDLRRAIADGELEVFLQPQIDLASGGCIGAEALLRWRNGDKGWISPGVFIPLAEQTGLILPLGRFVMEAACREAMRWEGAAARATIAVNVSPAQFLYQDIYAEVCEVLEATGLPSHRLELEITEGLLMRDQRAAMAVLKRLEDLGVQLAVDDFGTGYSSLSYLKQFPVQKLKVDQSFVREIEANASDKMIVRTIVTLASGLGLRTIAEGIETPAQSRILGELGCEEGQGYLFARPMPAADFRSWTSTWLAQAGAQPAILALAAG